MHPNLFETEFTVNGPLRYPAQMLADQVVDGHASVHDDASAAALGLAGAPIEGPTHFSQFDPLCVALWGTDWFERGCISSHFRTMVVEGEEVRASLTAVGGSAMGRIDACKADGTPVLTGTASVGPDHAETELDARRSAQGDPGELFIVDRLEVGMRGTDRTASIDHGTPNGAAYPFSLDDKLQRITEPHPWYTARGGPSSPWGRSIVPMEMVSVLANASSPGWPVRSPALGLFLDLEIRLVHGPVFVDHDYAITSEVIGLSQSRRTESYWTRTTLVDTDTGRTTAEVVLHSGVFKESYPDYPRDRLA
jgi:hypothetical protein